MDLVSFIYYSYRLPIDATRKILVVAITLAAAWDIIDMAIGYHKGKKAYS
ncbi:hypothetical protein [Aquimarina sp. AU119]|nr:hypothetical protein [Aquimarina sp. AU119]